MGHLMTKPTTWSVLPAKTQISLGLRQDAQADLSLHWVHSHFVGFVMRWLNCKALEEAFDKAPKIYQVAAHAHVKDPYSMKC